MKYTVTKELKSSIKINKYIELTDIFFIVGYIAVFSSFKIFVFEPFQIAFIISNILIAIVLCSKSPFNKRKKTVL